MNAPEVFKLIFANFIFCLTICIISTTTTVLVQGKNNFLISLKSNYHIFIIIFILSVFFSLAFKDIKNENINKNYKKILLLIIFTLAFLPIIYQLLF